MARNSIISYKNTIQMIVKKRAKVLFHGQDGAIGSLSKHDVDGSAKVI